MWGHSSKYKGRFPLILNSVVVAFWFGPHIKVKESLVRDRTVKSVGRQDSGVEFYVFVWVSNN